MFPTAQGLSKLLALGMAVFLAMFISAHVSAAFDRRRRRGRHAVLAGWRFPEALRHALRRRYPQLDERGLERLLEGLRAWLALRLLKPQLRLGQPSRAVAETARLFALQGMLWAEFHASCAASDPLEIEGAGVDDFEAMARSWGLIANAPETMQADSPLHATLMNAPELFELDAQLAISGGRRFDVSVQVQLSACYDELVERGEDGGDIHGSGDLGDGDSGDGGDGGDGGGD